MPADAGKNPETPNVVLICCDQLRSDWLGCNGHPIVQTPHIDQLAKQGLNFQRAWSECPICVPARRIMMTGQGPYALGLKDNTAGDFTEGPKLAECMTEAGYQTFACGKMHTKPVRQRMGFEDILFSEQGRLDHRGRPDDYHRFLADHGQAHVAYSNGAGQNQYGTRLSTVPERYTHTHWIADRGCDFLERRDPTRPLFLYLSFEQPHPPFTPPAEFWELYRDIDFPEPVVGDWVKDKTPPIHREQQARSNLLDWIDKPHIIQQNLRGYAAMITHIDAKIGMVMGQLRDEGVLDNTHIIFTADHGEALFDHQTIAKNTPFHGSVNVPFIVAPAKTWHSQRKCTDQLGREPFTTPVGLSDLMPTILDLAGVAIPDSVEGQSVAAFAEDRNANWRPWTFMRYAAIYAGTDGRYVYQWHADESNLEFLFDRQNDPRECHDLIDSSEHQEIRSQASQALHAWMTAGNDERLAAGQPQAIPFNWVDETTHTKSSFALHGRY